MDDNKIPQSVLVADAKNKLAEILSYLKPEVAEILLGAAHAEAAIMAKKQLEKELKEYKEKGNQNG